MKKGIQQHPLRGITGLLRRPSGRFLMERVGSMWRRALVLIPLAFVTFAMHSPKPLPMADPIDVNKRPLELFSASERRDSVAYREARRFDVPWRIAYAVTHAENFGGDSTAVSRVGAVGIFQIHPVNFNAYLVECYGGSDITDMARNACVGVNLLREYREQEGGWGGALRRYLGFRTNVRAWMAYTDDIIDHMVKLDD